MPAEYPTINAVKFRDVKSNQPQRFACSWLGLSQLLQISVANRDKTARELWSPVIYRPGTTRGNDNVRYVTCLVADMDSEAFDYARLDGLEYLAYTTWSHSPDDPHWHLVLPLAHPVPAAMWHGVWQRLHERIAVIGDPQTKDPARIFYRPQHRPGFQPELKIQHGEFLRPDLDDIRPLRFVRMPKTVERQTAPIRPGREMLSEAWWNAKIDLSEYDGMTMNQIHASLWSEWKQLVKGHLPD